MANDTRMQSIEDFILELHKSGIKIFVSGNELKVRMPKGVMTPILRTRIESKKDALIAFLSRVGHIHKTGIPSIQPVSRASLDSIPLSFSQESLWLLEQVEDVNTAYNETFALRLTGSLDVDALQNALADIVSRHESLRTTFSVNAEGEPGQVIHPAHFTLLQSDLTYLTEIQQQQEEIQALSKQAAQMPFDLVAGPLFHCHLFCLSAGSTEASHVLLIVAHHLIIDGWSMGLLVREISTLYAALVAGKPSPLPDLPIQYADYAIWQRSHLHSDMLARNLSYWKQQLSDAPDLLQLPTDRPRPSHQTFRGGRVLFSVAKDRMEKLKALAQNNSATLFMVVLSAFNILLARYSRQNDILVGSPIANRQYHELESLIGGFVSMTVLRTQLTGQQTFLDLLGQVKRTIRKAAEHQDIAFSSIVSAVQPTRDASYSPLFQVSFSLNNIPTMHDLGITGLQMSKISLEMEISKYDIFLELFEESDGLSGGFEYNTDLFNVATIEHMAAHFEVLLDNILSQPDQLIQQLSLLTATEVAQLQTWNETTTDYPQDQTLVDLFEAQVRQTPEYIAVSFEGETLTYQQLNARANQLAHYLCSLTNDRKEILIQPDTLVGICVERSPEMIIGLLGILKSGGAYVPLDPKYPVARLQHMLVDSQVPVLLTQQGLQAYLPEYVGTTILLDELGTFDVQPTQDPVHQITPHHLAYVIYTSGSTGKPKGVMIEHQSTSALINWVQREMDPAYFQGVLAATSINFDLSVYELFATLCCGGQIILAENVLHLAELADKDQVTLINTVPSAITELQRTQAIPDSVRCINLAGEALTRNLVETLYQQTRAEVICNLYGPSEDTTYSTFARLPRELNTTPTIGRPIANTRIYLSDASHQLVPIGVPGELCIAGDGLARGYLNRPDLTAQKFIEIELFGKTERVYRTGDLARWLPDGNLEYLGRIDHQVKLRGFRIELGEIEAVLSQQETVSEVVVVVYEREGNKSLAAYVTAADDIVETSVLQDVLRTRLPDYMVPNSITLLEQMPLTPNGKIDRKALPEPDFTLADTTYQLPRNATERQLTDTWSQVLKRDNISIHDNFFDLGGDSILSIQIIARARQIGLGLSPRDIFQHQTIADLALVVKPVSAIHAEQGMVQGEVPLTPIQVRFLHSDTTEPHHFNQAMLLEVPADLDVAALQTAFHGVLQHHDAFRLRYACAEETWQQSYQPELTLAHDLVQETLGDNGIAAAIETRASHWQASLDLAVGPLIRLVLFHIDDGTKAWPYRLLWVIHHLIVDGVSWRILLADLQMAYQQICAGDILHLPAKSTSFKAWSDYLQNTWRQGAEFAAEAAYWHGLPQLPKLPQDYPAGSACVSDTAQYTLTCSRTLTEQLLYQAPAAYRTGINDLLLSALTLALRDWTGQTTHLIDLESHGRADLDPGLDLSRTLGWFTSLYTVVLQLPDQHDDPGVVLRSIKEQLRQIPHEGIGYGLRRQQGEDLPQGGILFNYLGQFDQITDTDSGFCLATESSGQSTSHSGSRTHQIDINGLTAHHQLSLTFTYSDQQYQADTIRQLASTYHEHLQTLVSHCQTHYGYTPSDFPLVHLTQGQLTALQDRYADQIEAIYPLSPMQQGLLYHSLAAPDTGAYVTQLSLQLTGDLKPSQLHQAWQALIARHAILRTAFDTHDDMLQVVLKQATLSWDEIEPDTDEQQILNRARDFDLTQASLMRIQLERHSDTTCWLHWQHHHSLLDGWCLPILLRELFTCYQALCAGIQWQPTPVTPYQHYITWLQQQDPAATQAYWQNKLSGFSAPTAIPVLRHVSNQVSNTNQAYEHTLTSEQTAAWQDYAQRQRVTLNTLIQVGWASLLGRYSGDTDIVFGISTSGRNLPLDGIEQMVGLFINTLPLRVDLSQAIPDLLQSLQMQQQSDSDYAYTPLADIQTWSEVPNGIALFDSLIAFENYPLDGFFTEDQNLPLTITDIRSVETTNYALTLVVMPGEKLRFQLIYRTSQLSAAQAGRILQHLVRLMEGIVHTSTMTIQQLPLLTEAEINQFQDWNDTTTDYPADQTLVDLFETQARQTPDHIAVIFGDETLTYQQMNARSNQLAHYLSSLTNKQNKALIQPDTLVGICVERSLEMLIGLLGILKAGGAYVPLDPDYPAIRLQHILQSSQAPILLTQQYLQIHLPEFTGVTVLLDESDMFDVQPRHNLVYQITPRQLAYIIYTSGSTGQPKGVAIEHRGVVNTILDVNQRYGITSQDRVLAISALNFDLSVYDIFGTLAAGGAIVLPESERRIDPIHWQTLIQRHAVTVWNTVPALMQMLVDDMSGVSSHGLRVVMLSGDWIPLTLPERIQTLWPGVKIYSMGGATEASIWSIIYPVEAVDPDWSSIPYGRPMANQTFHVLDDSLNPCPVSIPGELYIGGIGLARGYWQDEQKTQASFIQEPRTGQRLYKTGDLGRYLSDGNIEFLGRQDFQVKIRGYRIELGEIEAALSQQASVSKALVVVHEREGSQLLAAYVTAVDDVVEASVLQDALRARLPEYMVPHSITLLEQIPLTPNGKIDRTALPEPGIFEGMTENMPPRDFIELRLLGIWQQVLNLDQFSVHDNFFSVGGHSLLAMRLIGLIRQQFDIHLPVTVLFQHATVAALARQIRQYQSDGGTSFTVSHCVPMQIQGEGVPIFILPGAVGSVLYLQPLAAALGQQQPVYALQTPGLYAGETAPDTVSALAAYHLAQIRQHQPQGPYQIIGHSSGGRVAFELAHQLEVVGETVALLAILDTIAPDPGNIWQDPQDDGSDTYQLWNLLRVFCDLTDHTMPYSLSDLQAMTETVACKQVFAWLQQKKIIFTEADTVDVLYRWLQVFQGTIQSHLQYQTQVKLTCPICLFRASDEAFISDMGFSDERLYWGWDQYTQHQVREIWVSGNHINMMVPPQVQELAAEIRDCL